MTCIVGMIDNGSVVIGGDSAGSAGHESVIRKDKKVWVDGKFIYGFTSSFRMGQILRWSFTPPERPEDMDVERYMNTLFINEVRKALSEGGYAKEDSGRESGGRFLVGYAGRLFEVQSDFQVAELNLDYNAVGCGDEFALGSLFSTEDIGSAEERVQFALRAASEFSGWVSPPFTILRGGAA